MILETYQSVAVLDILKKGKTYYAKPSISFRGAYEALIDMLGLDCKCPVFAVVKGRKQNTGGRVSASVRLTLNVPNDKIKLTEYSVWADFLYCYKFTKPNDYTKLRPDCEEVSIRRYNDLMQGIKNQNKLANYRYPQAILECIEPDWLESYKLMSGNSNRKIQDFKEKVVNLFRI